MSGVQIPVEAKLDTGDLDAELARLTQKINALGQSIAQANKVKFNPIDRATLDDLKRINAQFEAIKRASPNFAQRVAASGQANTPFVDLDWGRMIQSVVAREAQRYGIFTRVTAGLGVGFSPLTPSLPSGSAGGGSGGGTPPRPPAPPAQPSPGASWGSAGRNIVGAGLNAMGPFGGVANSALSAGLSGGAMAGLAGLVGGLAALGVGKAIGAIAGKVGDAAQDDIGYDTLKRQLGDVNVSFRLLQDSLHATAGAIEVTYGDVQKLGTEFARISGVSADLSKTLAEEVRVAGGFGRSFGVDPAQSTAFFARLRQFGVTRGDDDSRRMALTIGEAIAKSGAFSKSDEILRAIANFTEQQTRLGLTAANTSGYAGALAGLVGSGTPGLDPTGAANLLGRVNEAIAAGGGAGEAGQNFMYRAIGSHLGLNPIAARLEMEQGAFGSGAATFGPGSLFSRWAAQNGLSIPSAASSGETNIEMTLGALRKNYANGWLRLDAMHNLFGTNLSQSMALDSLAPAQLGGLQKALAASGVDLTKMSSTGISAMAQIATGDRGTLNEQARALWSRLKPDEAKQLDAAASTGDEALRKTLLQLTARYGQEQTDGDKTRQILTDASNKAQDAARGMLRSLDTIRDTLLYAFGDKGRMTPADMHKAVVDAQRKDVNDRADARIAKARARLTAASAVDDFGRVVDPKAQKEAYDNLQSETAAANKERAAGLAQIDADEAPAGTATGGNTGAIPVSISGGSPGVSVGKRSPGAAGINVLKNDKLRDYLAETDRLNGLSPGTSAAIGFKESGLDASRIGPINKNGTRDYGAFQINSANLPWLRAMFRKQYGRDPDPMDMHDGAIMQRMILSSISGPASTKVRGYNVGTGTDALSGATAAAYEADVERWRQGLLASNGLYGTPLPKGARASTGLEKPTAVHVTGEFHLTGQSGQPAAAPVRVATQVGAPTAFGTGRQWQ
ncbi:hypothetical protein [Burkholderia multivorans]|uniref:hypothetical protein n=1 Tax=Burkholderia multivorans TaxID=87883 RepID=UPI0019D30657|nr:hypothetical protein [Burkholderia multivorans]MBN6729292.1 hypothetical protein [Burkholderia multivorans]MBN6737151.1 hypothetical protein [Burkholderia multivorans]MBN7125805.1 lytic transglycosylase domain-containing protein [Burkholderia multivorans]MBN8167631.1 lytic transglycosylase domain-containing protein [Burkholderia multivorans]QSL25396.1 lytic transglycosylase domain-containing protein [Burkholderia multivorans]